MQHNKHQDTTTQKAIPFKLFPIILLLASLAHITADMYVPSLPIIKEAFKTNVTVIQYTLTVFMLGFGLAHLVFGPLSDRIGRRKPILIGIALSILGSILCLLSFSVKAFLIGRFLQGVGVAVCNSVGRSLVRDLMTGPRLAKISSYLGMIIVFVTATAPTLGGYIQHYFNWRVVFLFLFAYTVLVWFFTWKVLPETNLNLDPHATTPKKLIKNYLTVITNKTFLSYTLCVTFAYAGIISYVTSGPFLLQTVIGLTPVEYGWFAFITGGAIFLSFLINSRLVLRVGIDALVFSGSSLMFLGGLIMTIFGYLNILSTFVIIVPVAIFCLGAGFNFANASAGAFQPFRNLAGSAGAIFGCLQILGAATASALIAKLHFNNQIPLGLILIVCGGGSLLALKSLIRGSKTIEVIAPLNE